MHRNSKLDECLNSNKEDMSYFTPYKFSKFIVLKRRSIVILIESLCLGWLLPLHSCTCSMTGSCHVFRLLCSHTKPTSEDAVKFDNSVHHPVAVFWIVCIVGLLTQSASSRLYYAKFNVIGLILWKLWSIHFLGKLCSHD